MSFAALRCGLPHSAGTQCKLKRNEKFPGSSRQQPFRGRPQQHSKWTPLRKVCCNSPFYNREKEIARMNELIFDAEKRLTVLLGPRNSGKSALLNEYLQREKKDTFLVTHIDCRAIDANTPESFARAFCLNMRGQGDGMEDLLQKFRSLGQLFSVQVGSSEAKVTFKATEVWDAFMGKDTALPSSPIGQIKEAWLKLVKDAKPRVAVIFVDEANVLTKWGENNEKELDSLLAFCVLLTKQSKLGHVLLATSEDFFHLWIESKIGSSFYKTEVIGDMSEADARALFDMRCRTGKIGDDDWAKITEVCGYNPGLLTLCAGDPEAHKGNWDVVLEAMWKQPRTFVASGLEPSATAGFTAQQYARVVCILLDAPFCAERASVVKGALGGGRVGADVLAAMVKANLLAYRPYSAWATDIPKKLFGPKLEPVVTAPTAVDLFCMKLEKESFVQQLAMPTESSGQAVSSPPAAQAVEAKIEKVETKIEKVEEQIEGCVQQQLEAEEKGLQEKLQALRQREARLGENLKQLRKNLEQLREEKLLLLRGITQ